MKEESPLNLEREAHKDTEIKLERRGTEGALDLLERAALGLDDVSGDVEDGEEAEGGES